MEGTVKDYVLTLAWKRAHLGTVMADANEPNARDSTGRFPVGHQGFGGGRKRLPDEVRAMLECATPKAARAIIDALGAERAIVVDKSITMVPDTKARLDAATILLDRLYGKPSQAITNEDGSPVRVDAEHLLNGLLKITGG